METTMESHGYRILRGLLPEPRRRALYELALQVARHPRAFRADPEVPNTPAAYGDPDMEEALEELLPRVEAETSLRLFPTYSYYRVYKHGDVLRRHTDREACELSLSVALGAAPAEPWPLWLERDGIPHAITLAPGDALLYRGIDLPHWREAFSGEHAAQLFLHYVDQAGPYREWKYDRRPALSTW